MREQALFHTDKGNDNNSFDNRGRAVIFSENRKISPRQIHRALTLEIFGISSLLLPGYLAQNSGIFGVAAIAVGAAGAVGILKILEQMWRRGDSWGIHGRDGGCGEQHVAAQTFRGDSDKGSCEIEPNKTGQENAVKNSGRRDVDEKDCGKNAGQSHRGRLWIVKRIARLLVGIALLFLAVRVLFLLTALMRNQLLDERYQLVILLTLAGAGIFGVRKGLESRIRIYEVLFWFLMVPLIVILLIACVSVVPAYWCMTECSAGDFVKSCLMSFVFFALSFLVILFRPYCSRPEAAVRSASRGVGIAAALNVAVYLILLGIFQQKLLANLEFPIILLMAVVRLPGEFFERQDALMTGIWFFCLFALFDSLLSYGIELVRRGILND